MNFSGRIWKVFLAAAPLLVVTGPATFCFGHQTHTFTQTSLSSGTHFRTMFQDNLLTIDGKWSSESTPLSRRTDVGFALNEETGDRLLFGGLDETPLALGDTWFQAYGGSFTQIYPSTSPAARFGHGLVWVGGTSYLLFGGFDVNGNALNDTWLYNSLASSWTPLTLASSPSARGQFAFTYNPNENSALLFGGRDGNDFTSDNFTWIFSVEGASWTKVSATPNPGLLGGGSMAYDGGQNKFIFFGGRGATWDGADLSSKTWAFDPATLTWSNLNPSDSPPAVIKGQMIYDPIHEQCVLFGGLLSPTSYEDRFFFYSYEKNRWKELLIPTTPASREGHKMVYDPIRGGGASFGGHRNSSSNLIWNYQIYSSATWVSSPANIFGDTDIDWQGVSLNFDDPNFSPAPDSGSKALLQFSSSEDGVAFSPFLGPGGSTSTYFTSTDTAVLDLEDIHFGRPYMKMSAILTSDNFPARPKIKEFSLTFNRAPTPPVLKTPTSQTIVNDARPYLTWNLSGDIDGLDDQPLLYHLQMDTDPGFSSPAINTENIPKNSFDVQHQVTSDLGSATWYWRVRTKDNHSLYGGWSDAYTLFVDTISPPFPITQFSAGTGEQRGEIILTWTFPGDDDGRLDDGTLLIRFSTAGPISNETAWLNTSDERELVFSANPDEMVQSTVSGLTDATTYFFALKTRDEVGNVSDISQGTASAATQSPPDPVTGIILSKGPGPSDVTLTWTFPGRDGNGLAGGLVHIRASLTPISGESAWSSAPYNWSKPLTAAAGESIATTVTGLPYGTSFYFGIKTEGSMGQVSGVSLVSPSIHTNGSPLIVTSLSASRGPGNGELSLNWTFPGDYEGTLSGGSAIIRARSGGPILNESDWDTADFEFVFPLTGPGGTEQNHTVSGLPSASTYYLSVRVQDEFGAQSPLPASSPFSVTNGSPTVTLISPADGASIENPHLIQWTSFDSDLSDSLSFGLSLSYTSGDNYEIVFATALPEGTSSFLWHTSFLPQGNKYRIRVTATDQLGLSASDANDSDLIRTPPAPAPVVVFSSGPAKGQTLRGLIPLVWGVTNPSEYAAYSYSLYISTNAGGTFSLIESSTMNSILWDSRSTNNSETAQFKIVARDSGSPPGTGFSLSSIFILHNPPPPAETTLIYPIEQHHPSSFDLRFSWASADSRSKTYYMDVSTQSDFAGAIRYNGGSNTTLTLQNGALDLDKTFYWRVVAVDSENQETPSRTASFHLSRTQANTYDEFLEVRAVSGFPPQARIKFENIEENSPDLVESGIANAKGDRFIKPFFLPVWGIKAVDENGVELNADSPLFRIEFSFDQAQRRLSGQAPAVSPSLLKIAVLDETAGRWRLVPNQTETASASTNFTALVQGPGIFSIVGVPEAAAPLAGLTNFPNPFSPDRESTRIRYVLTEDSKVTIRIFNQLGDLAREMVFYPGEAGAQGSGVGTTNEITWDGRNGNGAIVSSGMYLVLIKTESPSGTTEKIRRIGVLR